VASVFFCHEPGACLVLQGKVTCNKFFPAPSSKTFQWFGPSLAIPAWQIVNTRPTRPSFLDTALPFLAARSAHLVFYKTRFTLPLFTFPTNLDQCKRGFFCKPQHGHCREFFFVLGGGGPVCFFLFFSPHLGCGPVQLIWAPPPPRAGPIWSFLPHLLFF